MYNKYHKTLNNNNYNLKILIISYFYYIRLIIMNLKLTHTVFSV